eukprot:52839-Eustigmatos_ZCMA.PRE.1
MSARTPPHRTSAEHIPARAAAKTIMMSLQRESIGPAVAADKKHLQHTVRARYAFQRPYSI